MRGRLGAQEPRVWTRPKYASLATAQEAIQLADGCGLHLDPWQQAIVVTALAERDDGEWSASEVAQLVARQNGKGAAFEAVFLHGLFLDERMTLQLWTAHQFKTSSEAFRRMRGWIDGSDDLRRRVKRMTVAHGDEGIELRDGSRLRFLARSKSSGRGFSPQRLGLDEAQELSYAAAEALTFALSAQPAKQILYAGTVPGPETNHPEVWTHVRDRGRAGGSPRLAWMEWSPEGSDDPVTASRIDLDDPDIWLDCNPAVPYRISLDTIRGERESPALSDTGFARERLSVWPTLGHAMVAPEIDPEAWARLACPDALMPDGIDPVALAVDVSPDRSATSVAVAWLDRRARLMTAVHTIDGTAAVDVVRRKLADGNVVDVSLHVAGPAGSLVADLEAAGISLRCVSTAEAAQATGALLDLVTNEAMGHMGQAQLTACVGLARCRPVGDARIWDRRDNADVAPIMAATLALHGFTRFAPTDYDVLESIA